jgi:hypothetical protein
MTIAYFKRGDPFVLDMWLYDATIGLTEDPDDITRGIELVPEDVTIECQVNSIQGKKLGSLTFEAYEDQVADKGKFLFQNAEPTSTWPVGIAIFDVKVSLMGQVKHSMSFKFNIVETYTP